MWLPDQATDQICTTDYFYSASSTLSQQVETCQQPLVTFGLYFLDALFIASIAYLIICFIRKEHL